MKNITVSWAAVERSRPRLLLKACALYRIVRFVEAAHGVAIALERTINTEAYNHCGRFNSSLQSHRPPRCRTGRAHAPEVFGLRADLLADSIRCRDWSGSADHWLVPRMYSMGHKKPPITLCCLCYYVVIMLLYTFIGVAILWRYCSQICNFSRTFARSRVAFLYQLDIPFTLTVLSISDFPFSRVRLANLTQKSFNRADSLKILDKYVLRLILFWRTNIIKQFFSHVNGMFNVYQQILHHSDVWFLAQLGCFHLFATVWPFAQFYHNWFEIHIYFFQKWLSFRVHCTFSVSLHVGVY